MNRISGTIRQVNRKGEGVFIPYLMAGDPTPDMSTEYTLALAAGGADLIELGVPFSDPVADGPTIQSAGSRALPSMHRLKDVLNLVRKVKQDSDTPIILMSYYNPILQFGEADFLRSSKDAGVDGLILPDLPVDEGKDLLEKAKNNAVETPLLATPDTTKNRLSKITKKTTGFLYLVARPGTTGVKNEVSEVTTRAIKYLKPQLPEGLAVCVGFGLSTPDQVAQVVTSGADGAIVGSAIVDRIADGYKPERIRKFVRKLKNATKT